MLEGIAESCEEAQERVNDSGIFERNFECDELCLGTYHIEPLSERGNIVIRRGGILDVEGV